MENNLETKETEQPTKDDIMVEENDSVILSKSLAVTMADFVQICENNDS